MNNKDAFWVLLIICIWCHVIDDFVLQKPTLCDLKQRDWWRRLIGIDFENSPYSCDYIMALAMHSMSWSVSILLPLIAHSLLTTPSIDGLFIWSAFCVNALIHGIVDDMKANKLQLNLVEDQLVHLVQIAATTFIYVYRTFI